MKRCAAIIAGTAGFIFIIVLIIPAAVIWLAGLVPHSPNALSATKLYTGENPQIKVYINEEKRIATMDLEEYVKGVIAGEMPAEFELEALKAQAVAARTYAVKKMSLFGGGGDPEHPGSDISTDAGQHQAWLSEMTLKERWGRNKYEKYWRKISQAVEETRGLVAVYQGDPIHAMFHSTCGQRTASAEEVWGFDYPYLKSVDCHWDKKSPRYNDRKEMTYAEVGQKLGFVVSAPAASLTGIQDVVTVLSRTPSGRVQQVKVGDKTVSGQQIREKLELRSNHFAIEGNAEKLVFKTQGYGHGVGLCQYGADGQAKEGRSFREILRYYYTGVEIKSISGS